MAGDMLSDALGIRRDLGPEDDIAAVRQRGREKECGRQGKKLQSPIRGILSWFCLGFVLLKIFLD